jgi:hypothetical protein
MCTPQHDKSHSRTHRNQDQCNERQKRREQKGNDNLRPDDDERGGGLHHVVRRRADALNVAAHQLGDARMLQARHHGPWRGCEPPGEAGADHFDKAHFDLRQHDVAAGNDNRPDNHDRCK